MILPVNLFVFYNPIFQKEKNKTKRLLNSLIRWRIKLSLYLFFFSTLSFRITPKGCGSFSNNRSPSFTTPSMGFTNSPQIHEISNLIKRFCYCNFEIKEILYKVSAWSDIPKEKEKGKEKSALRAREARLLHQLLYFQNSVCNGKVLVNGCLRIEGHQHRSMDERSFQLGPISLVKLTYIVKERFVIYSIRQHKV